MSPKKARKVYLIMYTVALLLAGTVYIMSKSRKYTLILPLTFATGITMIVASFIELAFWRCEYCGRYLGRHKFIEYCPHCGQRME